MGMAYDASGNLWVADMLNCVIRTVSPNGQVTTSFGQNPVNGFVNGYIDGPGNTARFYYPYGIAISPSTGTVYVTDRGNQCIRSISGGVVSTVAGACIGRTNLFVQWTSRSPATAMVDGQGTFARFVTPSGIAVVGSALYVVDLCVIRKIDLANSNTVTTWAGGAGGTSCGAIIEATGTAARFGRAPKFAGVLEASNHLTTDGVDLFMTDQTNQAIVKIVVSTRAVTRYAFGVLPTTPYFATATTPGGPLFVTDYGSIYRVFPGGGQWAPVAGYALGAPYGEADGVGGSFKGIGAIVFHASTGDLAINQAGAINMVRRVTLIARSAPPCDNTWLH
jgi:DNA-binding beta-propeller fold protein YncE